MIAKSAKNLLTLPLLLHNFKELYLLFSFLLVVTLAGVWALLFLPVLISGSNDTSALGFIMALLLIPIFICFTGLVLFLFIAPLFIKQRLNFFPRIKLILYTCGILVAVYFWSARPLISDAISLAAGEISGSRAAKQAEIDRENLKLRTERLIATCPSDIYPDYCHSVEALIRKDPVVCHPIRDPSLLKECVNNLAVFQNRDEKTQAARSCTAEFFDETRCAEELALAELDEKFCYTNPLRPELLNPKCEYKVRFLREYPGVCAQDDGYCQIAHLQSVDGQTFCQTLLMEGAQDYCLRMLQTRVIENN